jgi:energy-coupling factor transporter transmembrane protein EcfT
LKIVENSPLRGLDPRTKLALCLAASLAVMLPLQRLAVFMTVYVLLLLWARLLPSAAEQVWRIKWILVLLFALDWWFVGLNLAAIVTLRLVLLAGAFTLFFATTTPGEFRLALEWLRLPHRYAFSVTLAFSSLGLLGDEWRTIREAQQSRGAWTTKGGWRNLLGQVREMVALAVPVIVLTTKHAWAMTEVAYARGFDSPKRKPYRRLQGGPMDVAFLLGSAAVAAALIWLR